MERVFAENMLAGKAAFVMGGTRGMNLAITSAYAAHGARVAVSSRNPERCEHAAKAIHEATGSEAIGIPCDARDMSRSPRPCSRPWMLLERWISR